MSLLFSTRPATLLGQAEHQERDQLVLALEGEQRQPRRRAFVAEGVARVVGHRPVIDELARPGRIPVLRRGGFGRIGV
jgi:hypothetical protein